MSYAKNLESFIQAAGQHNRLLKLDTPLGPDVMLPQRVIGHERLGRSYEYTVDVICLRADIALKELIAQAVTLWRYQTDRSYLEEGSGSFSIRLRPHRHSEADKCRTDEARTCLRPRR